MKLNLGLSERIKTAGVVGAIIGILACIAGAIVGGYYISIALSNYLQLWNVFGRIVMALIIMVFIGRLAYPIGLYGGSVLGRTFGLLFVGSIHLVSATAERFGRAKRITYPIRKKRIY